MSDPRLEPLPHSRKRRVVRDFVVCLEMPGLLCTIEVPAGFDTDGASTPRPLWWLVPPYAGRYLLAVVVHDWLCEHADTYAERVLGDVILLYLMQRDGVPFLERSLIYCGVRWYGRYVWALKRQLQERKA